MIVLCCPLYNYKYFIVGGCIVYVGRVCHVHTFIGTVLKSVNVTNHLCDIIQLSQTAVFFILLLYCSFFAINHIPATSHCDSSNLSCVLC